jgi:hypothetical protein
MFLTLSNVYPSILIKFALIGVYSSFRIQAIASYTSWLNQIYLYLESFQHMLNTTFLVLFFTEVLNVAC